MSVQGHDIGCLSGKPVIDHHLTASRLIQDGGLDTVAEAGNPVSENYVHILNETVIPDNIVGNVILYILDAAVIPDCDIMESRMKQSRVLPHAPWKGEFLVEGSKTDVPGKTCMMHILCRESLADLNPRPV